MAPAQANFAPNLDKFRKSLKAQPLEASIESLISLLKRRQIKTPQQCAVATAHILLQVVARGDWKDVDQLLDRVQQVGRRVGSARPKELVIGNITKRVLGLIRDEAMEDRNADDAQSDAKPPAPAPAATQEPEAPPRLPRVATLTSLPSHITAQSIFSLLSNPPGALSSAGGSPFLKMSGASTPMGPHGSGTPTANSTANIASLRTEVLDGIDEIMDEISQADEQMAAFGDVYINPGDYVMVHRPTATVERFLARAASKRKFTVLIARVDENDEDTAAAAAALAATAAPPSDPAADAAAAVPYAALRKKLAAHGVPVVNLAGMGVMSYFPLATKVVLDARAITASGGLVADAGAGLLARAAKEFNRPVVALAGVYRLSPADLDEPEPVLEWGDPSPHADFADGDLLDGIDIRTPAVEYIGPEMVDIYITNLGAHSRHYLQSVIRDHYKQDDIDVFIQ
ncbi:translation regulator GCD7 [Magnaporthiopsis poae ATCC 64411]|uniref:Translation initiation factor eIF2B subunit beta n=1 Tax=Magnaporthiopsis poae (strain ATCC 64411 / 73-15) TaxID=644358 RepID=A0A0C4DSK7_MAGP6|nr:translation regulator GCD7 [Magnaporthiopsis poae ATCC 64411]